MKSKFFLILAVILISCDPKGELFDPTQSIAIKAQVINPKTEINLGDSVAFYFEVPDTVGVGGSRTAVTASDRDGANIGFNARKIISTLPSGSTNSPNENTCDVYAHPGTFAGRAETFTFANQNGKLKGTFYMIPRQKGVYLFEQTQEGYAWLNDKALSVRFSINFGNVNRNHQMLIDSAGASGFGTWLQDRVGRGMEVYGFRVK